MQRVSSRLATFLSHFSDFLEVAGKSKFSVTKILRKIKQDSMGVMDTVIGKKPLFDFEIRQRPIVH